MNKHATHVIIRFLKLVENKQYLRNIFEVIKNNFSRLAQDANGLPLIKNILAKFKDEESKKDLAKVMSDNAVLMA